MATSKPRFSITVSDDIYEEINTYQHEHRLATQTKAISELIVRGIETLNAPAPTADAKSSGLSAEAIKIAKDYDALDAWGQRTVRAVTDSELARVNGEPDNVVDFAAAVKTLPLLGNSFAAGPGEPDFGNFWEDYEVPADSPAEFAIRITGDSMEPYLPDGSVQLCRKAAPRDGDVGAFLIDGEFLVKQMCIDMTGALHLFSLNRDRKGMDRHLERNEDHTVLCFGTVIMKKRLPLPLD